MSKYPPEIERLAAFLLPSSSNSKVICTWACSRFRMTYSKIFGMFHFDLPLMVVLMGLGVRLGCVNVVSMVGSYPVAALTYRC